jgi:hypothetical protein
MDVLQSIIMESQQEETVSICMAIMTLFSQNGYDEEELPYYLQALIKETQSESLVHICGFLLTHLTGTPKHRKDGRKPFLVNQCEYCGQWIDFTHDLCTLCQTDEDQFFFKNPNFPLEQLPVEMRSMLVAGWNIAGLGWNPGLGPIPNSMLSERLHW